MMNYKISKKSIYLLSLAFLSAFAYLSCFNYAKATTINIPPYVLGAQTGLVGWWTFDGKDMVNNVADRSGTGNNGALILGSSGHTSTTSMEKIGPVGQALDFDGVDDYIDIGVPASLQLNKNYTISFWAKIRTYSNSASFIRLTQSSSISVQNNKYRIYYYGGYLRFDTADGTTGDEDTFATTLPLNTWAFFTCTLDNNNLKTCYRDGVSLGSATNDVDTSLLTPVIGYIGASRVLATYYLDGIMDDVRVYGRTLSASEVRQLYNMSLGAHLGTANVGPNNLSNGLVGWWTMDGKDVVNGVAIDKSGNGNNGNLLNISTSTFYATGKTGQAFNFDGTNDYVNVLQTNGLPIYSTTGYSASMWIKGPPRGSETCIYCEGNTSGGNTLFMLETDAGATTKFALHIRTDAASNVLNTTSNGVVFDNTWHHVVWTDNNGSTALYIDGQRDSKNFDYIPGTLTINTSAIGALKRSSVSNYYKGLVDDLRFYNRILSAQEVTELYNMGAESKVGAANVGPNLASGLLAWWTMDGKDTVWSSETAGTVVDKTSNGYTATLANMARTTAKVIGKIGQALKFDGSDDTVSTTLPSNIFGTAGPRTFSAWFKINTQSTSNQIANRILTSYSGVSSRFTIGIDRNSTANSYFCNGYNTGAFSLLCSTTILSLNKWYLGTVTYDGSNVILYLNGVQENSATGITLSSEDASTLEIGAYISAARYFSGSIDDVRVWNRALTAKEVQGLYSIGK